MNNSLNSLGIPRLPSETRVVVAMSGGVDSSVTAALLHHQGYEVLGITLQLYSDGGDRSHGKTCCAGQDIRDARRVAETIGIRHYVFDYEKKFQEQVVDPFVASYRRGTTPIPCISCNQYIKFKDLFETASDLGAHAMATGHYIRRTMGERGPQLHRAHDKARDQSYFLFTTTKPQLEFLRFPLGELSKAQVRSLAAQYGLLVAEKVDSQDICFVPDGDYAAMIERHHPNSAEPGEIVSLDGQVLGNHRGIIHYTVGQRRGLGISNANPYYVVRIESETNRVVVGTINSLMVNVIDLGQINWLGDDAMIDWNRSISVKFRSTQNPVPAFIVQSAGAFRVRLQHPERGVAPGQACVFYDRDRILGGGWISRTH